MQNIREIKTCKNILDSKPYYYEFEDKNISDKTHTGFPYETPDVVPHLVVATRNLRDRITVTAPGFALSSTELLACGPVGLAMTAEGMQPVAQPPVIPTDSLNKILNIAPGMNPEQVELFAPECIFSYNGQKFINYPVMMSHMLEAIKTLYRTM